jgi:hypothetical protein
MREKLTSANFGFLATHDVQLVRLGALAERYFKDDPNTCLLKLRQYGETLAQLVAAKAGQFRDPNEAQADLLRRLKFDGIIPREVGDLFHHLRAVGNKASHGNDGNHTEALTALKVGRELGVWFHRTFGPSKKHSRPARLRRRPTRPRPLRRCAMSCPASEARWTARRALPKKPRLLPKNTSAPG